jgi:hypothetical protein
MRVPSMNGLVALLGEVEENPAVLRVDDLQKRLGGVLKEFNKERVASVASSLSITGGFPEFGGVLLDLAEAYEVARRLAEEFHPLPVRVAAVVGEVSSESAQDGPAFDAAAELLYRARKEDRLLLVSGTEPGLDLLANTVALVLYRNLQLWTARQCEVVRLYRRCHRQRDVAEALGVTQQAVSNALASAGWRALEEAERSLARALSEARPGPRAGA